MLKALSVKQLINKTYDTFSFEGAWLDAFDQPETTGVWIIWGGSSNGKTSFALQLAKCLAQWERVVYNSREQGHSLSMQRSVKAVNMSEVSQRVIFADESIEELSARLSKRKSPRVAFIDSVQFARMTKAQFYQLKELHSNKLLVFVSQADGNNPKGQLATDIKYASDLKIWVSGFKAFSQGRYVGSNGGEFTIWEEQAAKYWQNRKQPNIN